MRRSIRFLALLSLLFVLPLRASGQAAVPPVVEVGWLADHLDDPNVVLLHVGNPDQFATAHIPGARLVSLQDVAAPRATDSAERERELALELPDPAVARERLQSLGISDDSHVIVYWGQDWVSPSTRVVLTLYWIGLGARTSLLDGGMPAWLAAGHATTDEPTPNARPGRISARPARQDVVVDAAWIQAHAASDDVVVIDARDAEFYDGTSEHGSNGHVPGAVSIPYTSLVDDAGFVRDRAALTALFRSAGVDAGDTIAVYCHIGQQATAIVFAARLTGHDVRLYDGSFQDWQRRDLPVENPAAAR